MNFNRHLDLQGTHALLSPSSNSWVNYSTENLDSYFAKYKSGWATTLGTVLHEYAEKHIKYKIKLNKHDKNDVLFYLLDHGIPRNIIDLDLIMDNLIRYVNDAIGFRMDSEVILKYSNLSYGTADSISFNNGLLRIHDLKTGVTPVHMQQLKLYSALFCLEYDVNPGEIDFETRIYQTNEDVLVENPDSDEIAHLMDIYMTADEIMQRFKEEA